MVASAGCGSTAEIENPATGNETRGGGRIKREWRQGEPNAVDHHDTAFEQHQQPNHGIATANFRGQAMSAKYQQPRRAKAPENMRIQ